MTYKGTNSELWRPCVYWDGRSEHAHEHPVQGPAGLQVSRPLQNAGKPLIQTASHVHVFPWTVKRIRTQSLERTQQEHTNNTTTQQHTTDWLSFVLLLLLLSIEQFSGVEKWQKYLVQPTFTFYIYCVYQTLLYKATYNKDICQKKEKQQYITVGTVRMFIEPSAKH